MTPVTPVMVFEELRFVWELLGAELLFLLPFAKSRPGWLMRALGGAAVFSLVSQLYFFWLFFWQAKLPGSLANPVIGSWYVLLALAIMQISLTVTFVLLAGYLAVNGVYLYYFYRYNKEM